MQAATAAAVAAAAAAPQPAQTAAVAPQPQPQPQPPPAAAANEDPAQMAPKLALSDTKIYHTGFFQVDVVIGDRWRELHGVSMEDVWRGGLHAEVLLEGSPELRVTCCSKCRQAKNVVELRVSGMSEFGPFPGPPGSHIERFRFDVCRSHCSSSRLHLGSRLILAINLPGHTAFSDAFELLSKKPSLRIAGGGARAEPFPTRASRIRQGSPPGAAAAAAAAAAPAALRTHAPVMPGSSPVPILSIQQRQQQKPAAGSPSLLLSSAEAATGTPPLSARTVVLPTPREALSFAPAQHLHGGVGVLPPIAEQLPFYSVAQQQAAQLQQWQNPSPRVELSPTVAADQQPPQQQQAPFPVAESTPTKPSQSSSWLSTILC